MYIINLIGKANNWGWIKIALKASSLCHIPNIQLNKISNPNFEQFKNETFLLEPLDIYKL